MPQRTLLLAGDRGQVGWGGTGCERKSKNVSPIKILFLRPARNIQWGTCPRYQTVSDWFLLFKTAFWGAGYI